MAVNDKYRANDIINDFEDDEIDLLYDARDGFIYDEDDDLVQEFLDKGYVKVVNFEYVHARNSIKGIVTTADGDKLLQELDNRPIVAEEEVTIIDNGANMDVKTVDVKDPNPAENIPENEQWATTDSRSTDDPNPANPGDLGTILEKDKDEKIQKKDQQANKKK